MGEEDQPKTTFIADEGVFCYKLMSFSFENAKIIYKKMMNKAFKDQVQRNLEVYVDNMLIKSRSLDNHLVKLEENFIVMQKNMVKINLAKFLLGIMAKNFLRFM